MELKIDNTRMTPKEMVEIYMSKQYSPVIIKCHSSQDWRILFDEQPVIINALEIDTSELLGIDYGTRTHFTPKWFQELLVKKILIIENLDSISMIDQLSFLHLCRNPKEDDVYRSLGEVFVPPENRRERIYNIVPKDVTTFIIIKDNPKDKINPQIYSRSYGTIDLEEMCNI